MKKLVTTTAIVFSIFLMSCSVSEEGNTATQNTSEIIDIAYAQLDYEIAELINAHRISIGLQALNILNHASYEAISHNQYMVNQGMLSHDHFSERSQNLKAAVDAKQVSENVGYGYSSAESLVNAWLNSEGHRQAIENPIYTDFGISSKKDAIGSDYVTNIFVKL